MGRRRPRGDRGETLIEVLVAVMLMGTGVVVLLGGLATTIRLSALHRSQATAGTYVRAYAEAVEAAVNQSPTAYVSCGDPAAYTGLYATGNAAFTPRVVSVRYWGGVGTGFVNVCTGPTDSGVQELVLSIDNADDTETLTTIIRRPCRSRVDFPTDPACS